MASRVVAEPAESDRPEAASSPPADRWGLAIVGLVALAAVTRALGLDGGLWIDEIYSLVRSFRAPLGAILTEYWGDNHHPFYAVLAHGSRSIFGESPWTIRLPSLLFGVATVPLLAQLGRAVGARREGLAAALLLAVSYHHVWFSQNARGYSAIACLTVAGMWLLLRALSEPRRAFPRWLAYAVVAALGAYTHLTMILVVVGHAAAVAVDLTRRRRWVEWRGPLMGFGGAALLTLALYAPMADDVIAFFGETKSNLRGVSTPGWAALEGLRVLVMGVGGGLVALGAVVVLGGAAVAAAGTVSLARRAPLFVLLVAMPMVATLAGAALARGTLYPRFFFFAIGPALLIATCGTRVLAEWLSARWPALGPPRRLFALAVGLVAVLSAASLAANYRFPKQDFAGAMAYVVAQRAAGDLVVSTGVPADPYRTLYGQEWPNVTSREALDSLRTGGHRVWVLSTFPRYIEASTPAIAALLRAECPAPRVFPGTVGGGDIHVCLLDPR